MRTAVACFVLAAAIATPGIVLAATSGGPTHGLVSETGISTASANATPVLSEHVDPLLRPSVDAVRRALERRGGEPVHVFPAGAGMAQLLQLPSSAHQCSTTVTFELGRPSSTSIMITDTGGPRCSSGSTYHGGVHVTYSPTSVGPTVKQALATLPR